MQAAGLLSILAIETEFHFKQFLFVPFLGAAVLIALGPPVGITGIIGPQSDWGEVFPCCFLRGALFKNGNVFETFLRIEQNSERVFITLQTMVDECYRFVDSIQLNSVMWIM